MQALELLAEAVVAALGVDPARQYLTGLSMGGYGTWSWCRSGPRLLQPKDPHTPTHTHTHPHTHTLHEMARITSDSSLPGFVPPEADLRILRAAGRPGDLLLRYTDAGVRAGLPAGPAQRGLPGLHRLGEPLPPAAGAKREGSCATALPLPCRVLPPPLQHGRFLSGSAGRTPTRSGRTCG